MAFSISQAQFLYGFEKLKKQMREIHNEDYRYDVERSEETVVKDIPLYIYFIFKINDLEFLRVEFEANYPVEDKVIFVQKTKVSDSTIQEFLDKMQGW